MKVDRYTAQVRYNQDTGRVTCEAVEIGAEVTVDERERCTPISAGSSSPIRYRPMRTTVSSNGLGEPFDLGKTYSNTSSMDMDAY